MLFHNFVNYDFFQALVIFPEFLTFAGHFIPPLWITLFNHASLKKPNLTGLWEKTKKLERLNSF